jgi:hypothetical protein
VVRLRLSLDAENAVSVHPGFLTAFRGDTGVSDRAVGVRQERRRHGVATRETRGGIGGISLGGILVIIGIVVAIFWSVVLGVIIALIGLIAFGGFARGRWY